MRVILGATLVAHGLPVYAGDGSISSYVRGIDQADIRGIDQADIRGIDQADIRGIDQADIRGIDQADIRGIDQADIRGIDQADVLLFGRIDSVNEVDGTLSVVGQTVFASRDALAAVSIGSLVQVAGTVVGPGHIYADRVTVSAEQYVPGSTEVYVTGIPSVVDTTLGRVSMGGLEVDYTSSLSRGYPAAGTVWTFRGTQPNIRGLMVAGEASAR
jgi:hypothetical protein